MTARQTHRRTHTDAIVIRDAGAADERVLADLAALDERAPLTGPALIAEVDGRARAALDLHDGSVAADPFARTDQLVELLRLQARAGRGARTTLRDRAVSLLRPVTLRA